MASALVLRAWVPEGQEPWWTRSAHPRVPSTLGRGHGSARVAHKLGFSLSA